MLCTYSPNKEITFTLVETKPTTEKINAKVNSKRAKPDFQVVLVIYSILLGIFLLCFQQTKRAFYCVSVESMFFAKETMFV